MGTLDQRMSYVLGRTVWDTKRFIILFIMVIKFNTYELLTSIT